MISYVAESPRDLEAAFREAVDDYLAACLELGDQPDVPCKGGLNIRIGPDRHRAASIAALQQGSTLNDWICRAIDSYLVAKTSANVTNHLTVNLYGHSQEHQVATSTGIPAHWSTIATSAAGALQH